MAIKRPLVIGASGFHSEIAQGDTLDPNTLGGSGATLKSATVTGVTYGSVFFQTTITDASVVPASKIVVDWGNVLDTEENSPEMDNVYFLAIPVTGSFVLRMFSTTPGSMLGGTYKINYLIQ